MNRALKEIYAERRTKKLKMIAFAGMAIIAMYAIWSIATYDFCPLYYSIKCF